MGRIDPPETDALISHPRYALRKDAAPGGARFTLAGDVNAQDAARLLDAMKDAVEKESLGDARMATLCLGELELSDGVALARMVDLVRLLLGGARRVRVVRPPQTLAHVLYRVGMLAGDARLALVEPRQEEGIAN